MPNSALNLRLVLALAGAVLCAFLAVVALATVGVLPALLLVALAVGGLVDAAVVQQRRTDRARRHVGAGHRHDSLFE